MGDVAQESTSSFERRPCPVCGRMLSILKLEIRLLPYTCPYCHSELLISIKGTDRITRVNRPKKH